MKILLVGGGEQQVKAVEMAQEIGYHVDVTDRDRCAPCRDVADGWHHVDGTNVDALYICAHGEGYHGVLTMTELVEPVARLAERLGLPTSGRSAARRCQDKWASKMMWVNLPTPAGWLCSEWSDVTVGGMDTSGLFVKPQVGSGGVGAHRLTRESFDDAMASSPTGYVVVEEYLEGTHHDIQGIFDPYGRLHCAGISDRYFDDDANEIGASCPTTLSDGQQADLLDLTEKCAHALGIWRGGVKGDAVLTDRGLFMLEMAPRLHGPKSSLWLIPEALGTSPLEAYLQVVVGHKLDADLLVPRHERPTRYDLEGAGYMMGIIEIGRRP